MMQKNLSVRPDFRFHIVGAGTYFSHPAIPGPYPITPPEGKEAADAYYVVDYGREVGIFDDE